MALFFGEEIFNIYLSRLVLGVGDGADVIHSEEIVEEG
jgi:hypothetical protein